MSLQKLRETEMCYPIFCAMVEGVGNTSPCDYSNPENGSKKVFSIMPNNTSEYIPVFLLPAVRTYHIENLLKIENIREKITGTVFEGVLSAIFEKYPLNMHNAEWYCKILKYFSSLNMYGNSPENILKLANETYYVVTKEELAGRINLEKIVQNVPVAKNSVDARYLDYFTDAFRYCNTNKLHYVCANGYYSMAHKTCLISGGSEPLSNSSVYNSNTNSLGYVLMLKTKHYKEWLEAFYSAEIHTDFDEYGDVLVNRCSRGDVPQVSVTFNPKWFTFIKSEETLATIQSHIGPAAMNDIRRDIIIPMIGSGVDVVEVGNTCLDKYAVLPKVNFKDHIVGNLQDYEKNAKELLIRLSSANRQSVST